MSWDFAAELGAAPEPAPKIFNPDDPQPGIYYDVPNEVYHSATKAISNSILGMISDSVSAFPWVQDTPVWEHDDNDSLDIGEAVHAYTLERQRFDREYVVMPPINMRTNRGKEEHNKFLYDHRGQYILSAMEFEKVKFYSKSLLADPRMKMWLNMPGHSEVVVVVRDPETDLLLRIRVDRLVETPNLIVALDVKSTETIAKFKKSFVDYRYHVQEALYRFVLQQHFNKPVLFLFGAVAKHLELRRSPVRVSKSNQGTVDVGYAQFRADLKKMKQAIESNDWIEYEEDGLTDKQMEYYHAKLSA